MRAEFVSHPVEGNLGEFSVGIPKTLQVPGQQIPGQFSLLLGAELPSFLAALPEHVQPSYQLDFIVFVISAHSPRPRAEQPLALGSSWNSGSVWIPVGPWDKSPLFPRVTG